MNITNNTNTTTTNSNTYNNTNTTNTNTTNTTTNISVALPVRLVLLSPVLVSPRLGGDVESVLGMAVRHMAQYNSKIDRWIDG